MSAKIARSARFHSPAHPPKPLFSPMAAPRRHLEHITHFASTGWGRTENSLVERCTVTAHFSSGRTIARDAIITYQPGQRERLMESVLANVMSPKDHALARWVRGRRWTTVEEVYGSFHSDFGKGANFE